MKGPDNISPFERGENAIDIQCFRRFEYLPMFSKIYEQYLLMKDDKSDSSDKSS